MFLYANREYRMTKQRIPIKVNEKIEKDTQYIDEYIKEKTYTIQPATKVVEGNFIVQTRYYFLINYLMQFNLLLQTILIQKYFKNCYIDI